MPGKPLIHDLPVGESGKWRVVGPTGFRSTGLHKERGAHDHAAEEIDPVRNHIELRERHIHRTDLERRDVISEGTKAQGNDAEEDHDCSVHRSEHVVGLTGDFSVLQPAGFPFGIENPAHPLGEWLVGIGDAPAHDHHQVKSEC